MTDEPTGQGTEGSEPRTYDEAHVKKLNNEAAGYRVERNELKKQVEDLTGKLKAFEDKGKSDLERLADEKAELERKLKDVERGRVLADLRATVVAEASKLNIVDPDVAFRLLDISEFEDTTPKSVAKALTTLIKDKAYLVKSEAPPTAGAGGPPLKDGKKSTDDMWATLLKGESGAPKR